MDIYKNVRGSWIKPAGRGPSSRGLSAGTYAGWGVGVTIRLSSDVRPWSVVSYRIRDVRPWMDGVRIGRAWASHPVGWHVGKKKAGYHRWRRLADYRKAYNRLLSSCIAFLLVNLRFLHSRRKAFISSYLLLAGGSFTLRTSLLISS